MAHFREICLQVQCESEIYEANTSSRLETSMMINISVEMAGKVV
jgi:hypothetical protein